MTEFRLKDLNKEETVLKSIRMKASTFNKIEEASMRTNISMNKIMNECIEFAMDNLVIDEEDLKGRTVRKKRIK